MNAITVAVLIFSVLGALDKLLGDRFGLGKEFERAFSLFTPMVLSMLGILVLAPAIGVWLMPVFDGFYAVFGIDPSVIPASLFANDMGGMTLAQAVCKTEGVGGYNAFVVSSMMGCTISFTIPFASSVVKPEQQREMFLGLLCGIITVPVGCFVAGLMCGLHPLAVLVNLLPLLILSVLIAAGLVFAPNGCIKVFSVFGKLMRAVSILGLILAIFTFLTKITVNEHFDTLENAASICVNACVTLSGTLPLMFLVSKLLGKTMGKLGAKLGVDDVSAVSALTTLVTNVPTFGAMEKMDKKGVVLNAAFAVSAGFVFGGHLALTMAFDKSYVVPMIVGKLVSGIFAVVLGLILYKEKPTPVPANSEPK